MNHHILMVGSIFFVTLFLIAPSIPAIQKQSPSDLKTEIKTPINKNLLKLLEHHPLLYLVVLSLTYFWFLRVLILFKISTEPNEEDPIPHIKHPLIFLRAALLLNRIDWWLIIWDEISHHYGWGWEWSQ